MRGQECLATALLDAAGKALPLYYLSGAIVLLGAVLGRSYVPLGAHSLARDADLVAGFAAWDGRHYVSIVEQGYAYDPNASSTVAFFPAHPLVGRWLSLATGWRADYSLTLASNIFLIAALAVAVLYLQDRAQPDDYAAVPFALGALALFPTTFYFRMAYTESLFLLEVIIVLLGMQRRWPLWAIALVIGLATATRAAGVALLVPFAWHVHERSGSWTALVVKAALLCPAACWGLLAYMGYLYLAFGDPLAFAKTQRHWDQRPGIPIVDKLLLEIQLEPIFCEYDPACHCHRLHSGRDATPVFSMYFANPVYFLLFAGLVALGAAKGWLTRAEILAAATLLLFSYLSKSYATCMCSQARYASTVFPAYIVLGRVLQVLPGPVAAALAGISGFFLGVYAALFVRWHDLY